MATEIDSTMPETARMLPHYLLRLPRFSAEPGQSVEEFVREAELPLSSSPVTTSSAYAYIIGALEGAARRRITRLPRDQIDTPDKILAVRTDAYGDHKDVDDIIATNTLQRGAITDTHLVAQFAKGLRNKYVRREIAKCMTERDSVYFVDTQRKARNLEREETDLW